MKKIIGPILAVFVFVFILFGGYFIGKYIANQYNEKHNTKMSLLEIIKVETQNIPINYLLKDGPKNIKELCGKDTGLCNKDVGVITLNNIDIALYIYYNFDNPNDDAVNYFKLRNTKIGSFVFLEDFAILGNYLIVTEPNSYNNNYIIHIYDYNGKEVAHHAATNINKQYEVKNNNLYYYYCDSADTKDENGIILPKISYIKVNSDKVTEKSEESFEYKACT